MAFMALLPSLIAAAGAVGGGYLASRGSSHSSSSGKTNDIASMLKKIPALNKDQRHLLEKAGKKIDFGTFNLGKNPLYKQGSDYISNLMNPSSQAYESMARPEMQQFQEQIVPSVAERFGGVGALSSSGFNQAMAHEAGSLGNRLASLRTNMQMQALPQALGYAQAPMNPMMALLQQVLGTKAFNYFENPPAQPGGFSNFMSSMAPGLGQGIGTAMGGANWSNMFTSPTSSQQTLAPGLIENYRAPGFFGQSGRQSW